MLCYKKIIKEFGFSQKDDENSAKILNNLLMNKKSLSPQKIFIKEKSIIFGAGPSLKDNIEFLKNIDLDEFTLIAADGATSALAEDGITPHIIVTDLDGEIDHLLKADQEGSIMVVHAHGDNPKKIRKYVPQLHHVMGTTQTTPNKNVYNMGGFTDGDRGVFLAVELGVKCIVLAGMDFGKITTRYSRPNLDSAEAEADIIKQKKLEYGKKLVEWVARNEDVTIINISKGEKIEGVDNLTLDEAKSRFLNF
jgi:uncharacterized Rossmann fold enzyme